MKTIIFDFDGVIHDTYELTYQISVEVMGKDLTREKHRSFSDGNIFDVVMTDSKKGEECSEKIIKMQNEALKCLKIDENIRKCLETLHESYPLFIISSNRESALDAYFQNNNFTHIFKEILGAETHQSKVEKFKYIFEKYDLATDDCIFVTDTLGDILEANKVGLKTIAVDFGFHERERLEKGNPFKIVSSFDEVIASIM